MRVLRWLIFVCVVPLVALGIGLWCAFISLKQGIECAGEMLDDDE
jgi:hypothetical protein